MGKKKYILRKSSLGICRWPEEWDNGNKRKMKRSEDRKVGKKESEGRWGKGEREGEGEGGKKMEESIKEWMGEGRE